MNPALIHHDRTCTRQGAPAGLRELQQLSCQGLDALLVHVKSFQVRLVDGFIPINEKGQGVVTLRQGASDV